jgi:hypothetical protein
VTRWLLSAALAAGLAGCAVLHPPQPKPEPNDPPWGALRDQYTRNVKLYDLFDDRAYATATYLPWAVRSAELERIAAWRALDDQDRSAAEAADRVKAAGEEMFYLAFYTGNRADNDLDVPTTIWRIRLVVGDVELAPRSVELIKPDTMTRMLYPYIGDFDHFYQIKFPAWTGGKPLTETPFVLLVAGAPGKVKLAWTPGEKTPKRY